MSKYGFDYYLKRTELLNEMARPVSVFTGVDPELKPLQDVYTKLLNQVAPITGKDTGKRQFFVYGYLLSLLMDVIEPDLDMDVGAYASEVTGLPRGFNTMKSAFLRKAVEHKDVVNSPEFLQAALDDNNIQHHASIKSARGGNRRTGYENEVQSTLGTSAQDFESVSQQAEPIVTQLNRLMGNRKAQMTQGRGVKPIQSQSAEQSNPNVDFAYSIVDAIEDVLEGRERYIQAIQSRQMNPASLDDATKVLLSDAAKQLVETVKGMYEDMIKNGTGTTPEEFDAQISKMAQEANPKKALLYNLIRDEVHDLADFSAEMAPMQNQIGSEEKDYEGYDKDILQKVLDTPEKVALFDKWHSMNSQWRKAKNEKLEQLWMRKLMQINFFDRKGVEDDGSKFLDADIKALLGQQHQISQLMADEHNPQKIEVYKKRLKAITDQIKFKRGESQPPAQEQEEGGVMGYMTEQVVRDSHTAPKGKFVERGFKKPQNYYHYLAINENI